KYILFCHMELITQAIIDTHVVHYVKEAIYFRRKRHDPIRNPSLRQIDRRDYALSFFELYNDMKNIHSQQQVQKIVDKQLLNFYSTSIVNYFDGKVSI